ncbi:MAG: carboxylase, partial [Desulfamplus sp.]|nr:carboxylase [Desulfamplus sp.]
NQLREMDALDRIGEVYKELPKVRRELGQVPLVTPTSQIVGTQTVNNVLFDTENERYKMITAQVKDLCYGLYGKTAIPIDPEVQKKALKNYDRGSEPITCRPAEVLKPELAAAKEAIGELAVDDDDLLVYTLFPVTGKKYLQIKYGKEPVPTSMKPITLDDVAKQAEIVKKAKAGELVEKSALDAAVAAASNAALASAQSSSKPCKCPSQAPAKTDNLRTFNVFVDGEYFEVGVDEVGGSPVIAYAQQVGHSIQQAAPASKAPTRIPPPPAMSRVSAPKQPAPSAAPKPAMATPVAAPKAAPAQRSSATQSATAQQSSGGAGELKAPMPGMIIRYEKSVGQSVKKGDIIVVLEAMKMENGLPSPIDGVVKAVSFASGDSVPKGSVLALIE